MAFSHNLAGTAQGRIPEFDLLRAVAVLLLMLHHGGIYNFSLFGGSLQGLQPFVSLYLLGAFLFISGYLLALSLQHKSLKQFLTTRLARIYFPYLVALTLFLAFLEVDFNPRDLLIHLLGAQMVLSPRLTTPVLTLWFIGLLLTYYVLFGGLYQKVSRWPWLAITMLLVFLAASWVRMEWGFLARRFFYYYFVFGAGLLIAKNGWLPALTTRRYALVDKLAAAGLGVAALYPFRAQVGPGLSLPLVAAMTLYVLSLVMLTLSLAGGVANRWRGWTWISEASFFAYLLHRPIWELGLEVFRPQALQTLSLYLILLGTLVVLPVAYGLQKGYNLLLQRRTS